MGFFKKLFRKEREFGITDDLLEFLKKDDVQLLAPILDESGLWEARRLEERLAYQAIPDEVSHLFYLHYTIFRPPSGQTVTLL